MDNAPSGFSVPCSGASVNADLSSSGNPDVPTRTHFERVGPQFESGRELGGRAKKDAANWNIGGPAEFAM